MNILVTGSSGFVARFLIPSLASAGHTVTGIDKEVGGSQFGSYFKFVHGNILDKVKVEQAIKDIDLIVHLAAEHQDFGVPKELYYEVNVKGMEILLEFARRYNVDRFIFYSSVAVYGNNVEPSHEEMKPEPLNPYGESKYLAEGCLRGWYEEDNNRQIVIIRPAVLFGPYNYANMYRLISAIARKRYFNVGDGKNIKSAGYVENVVAATLFLLGRMAPGVEIYNYADAPHLNSSELASIIADALHVNLSPLTIPRNLAMILATPLDVFAKLTKINLPITSDRIKKFTATTHHQAGKITETGFQAPYTLKEGLRKMVSWMDACSDC